MAILEPRISGKKANDVVKKIGLECGVRVEANGFSRGIWCLWNPSILDVLIIASSNSCIHLKINPNSLSPWFLTVVYASPHPGPRLKL